MTKTLACNKCNNQVFGDCVAYFEVKAEDLKPIGKPVEVGYSGNLWCENCGVVEKFNTHVLNIPEENTQTYPEAIQPLKKCPKCEGVICAEVINCTAEVDEFENIRENTLTIDPEVPIFEYSCVSCREDFEYKDLVK